MLLSLSEIIRINPEHSHDRGIAEKNIQQDLLVDMGKSHASLGITPIRS